LLSPRGGFCLARLAKSAPRSLLVNRFTVLDVEEVNTDISEPIDAPSLASSAPDRTTQPRKPTWEKRLPKQLSVNTLDARGTLVILPIKVSTTDTSEVHSVKALLDSGATGNFIDRDFVQMKGINTRSISRPILVYNVDSSPNEAGQISEVVDVVLRYKTHSERTLKHRGSGWRPEPSTSVGPDPSQSMRKTRKRMRPPFGLGKLNTSKETDCS